MRVYDRDEYIESKNPLKGQHALFVGDSITNAAKDTYKKSGWAGRIGRENKMIWKNAGINAASVSTIRGSNQIVTQIINSRSHKYDYVILHGGVNDAMDSAPIGNITSSFNVTKFNNSTFAGGLEELFCYTYKCFYGAKIGYIVNYATPNSNWGGETKDMSSYFNMAKKICEKWSIPYIDLFDGKVEVNGKLLSYSYDILKMDTSECLYDCDLGEVHIGGKGYDVISPYIADWMKTLK